MNGSCDKSRNVSFSNVESEVIGYGGEEYSTDEEYSSDEEKHSECLDSEDDDELRRLTEANTNVNGKLFAPERSVSNNNNNEPTTKAAATVRVSNTPAKPTQNISSSSPPLVTVQPFSAEPPKSLVFNFLKNKEIVAANATAVVAAAKVARQTEKKDHDNDEVQMRKTETTRKPTLSRSSLVAHSNEPYLNIKRCSLQADEEVKIPPPVPNVEIPEVKLHPPETVIVKTAEDQENEAHVPTKDVLEVDTAIAPYKTRSNVPRMGTMHFKLKLAVAASSQKPEPSKSATSAAITNKAESTPESSLTSREMAGEPDGKADSDEPCDPAITTMTTTTTTPVSNPVNRSFLHTFKEVSSPLRDTTNHHSCTTAAITSNAITTTTPPRTPIKKVSLLIFAERYYMAGL